MVAASRRGLDVAAKVDAHRAAGNCGEIDHYGLETPRVEVTRLAGELKRSLLKGRLVRHLAAFETDGAVAMDHGPVLLIINHAGELGDDPDVAGGNQRAFLTCCSTPSGLLLELEEGHLVAARQLRRAA